MVNKYYKQVKKIKDTTMKYFLLSLLSRKFLLAMGTFLVFIANNQYNEALGVVLAYIGLEGAADVATRVKDKGKTY